MIAFSSLTGVVAIIGSSGIFICLAIHTASKLIANVLVEMTKEMMNLTQELKIANLYEKAKIDAGWRR